VQLEAVALLDFAASLVQQQLVPLLHFGWSWRSTSIVSSMSGPTSARAQWRQAASSTRLPSNNHRSVSGSSAAVAISSDWATDFSRAGLTAEQQIALNQTDRHRAGVLIDAHGDRLPQAQPGRVQVGPGQPHGAGQRIPAHQSDLGVASVVRIAGDLDLTELEIGGQSLDPGLQVGRGLAGGQSRTRSTSPTGTVLIRVILGRRSLNVSSPACRHARAHPRRTLA
jgi:hypothetical protein